MKKKEQEILRTHIQELERENFLLKEELKENKVQIHEYKKNIASIVLQRTQELEEMNIDLQSAKHELEQYKNHLEEVIRERTIDLKSSEQRFISVSKSLMGGSVFEIKFSNDETYEIRYLNNFFWDMIGVNVKYMLNGYDALKNYIHPEDTVLFQEKLMHSKHTKDIFDVEIRILPPEKPMKSIHIRANTIEESDNYTIWVGLVFDTTEKNKFQYEIQEREVILNAIIQNIPYDFWAIDSNKTCFLQNRTSKKLWGNLLGKSPSQVTLPETTKTFFLDKIEDVLQNKLVNEEVLLADRHGNKKDFKSLLAPIILHEKIRGILCFNIDISERKHEEKARVQNEQKFRNIFDNSTDAIIIQSHQGDIIEMNNEFIKLSGVTNKSDTINVSHFIRENDKSNFFRKIDTIKNTSHIFIFETTFITQNNKVIPIEIKSKEIEYLDNKVILSLIRNIAYRKKFERKLVNTIIETEEKERARLAADLHDDIGPILSSMKMLTGLLRDASDIAKTKVISDQIFDLVTESLRSLRETSNSLSPHVLKNYGIIAATRNIIQSFQHVIPISVETNCEKLRFESTIEIIYYRVLRELLTNTIKHAQATKININLHYINSMLIFTYQDNGIGFNVAKKMEESSSGMGLYNIINRISSLEANYTIDSSPGKGFIFTLKTNITQKL